MKPNFNPKYRDLVRVRLHTGEVVNAQYYYPDKEPKTHRVKLPPQLGSSMCKADRRKPEAPGRCRFVYLLECMPDYKPKS
jgi:hypothetical protein